MKEIRIHAVYRDPLDIERLAAALVELTLELEARSSDDNDEEADHG